MFFNEWFAMSSTTKSFEIFSNDTALYQDAALARQFAQARSNINDTAARAVMPSRPG